MRTVPRLARDAFVDQLANRVSPGITRRDHDSIAETDLAVY